MLFAWYLRDWLMCPMCHAFPFPSTFPQLPSLHPLLCASGFHYLPHSLPVPFFCHTFTHPACLLSLSHLYSQQSLFSDPYFSPSCLSLCLATNLPAPFFNPPSYLLLILSSLAASTPRNYHPTFHGKVSLLFPSFEAFPRFFQ